MKDHITIAGHDGALDAYIARPETVPAPASQYKRVYQGTRFVS